MTFSIREAALNDDEEWLNIPGILRSFLRQINNEVNYIHLTCDKLVENQRSTEEILKDMLSRQSACESEHARMLFAAEQRRQEAVSSLHVFLNSIKDEVDHLKIEHSKLRDSISEMEQRHVDMATQVSRTKAKWLSRTLNNDLKKIEEQICNGFSSMKEDIVNTNNEVQKLSEKQIELSSQSRRDVEFTNSLLQEFQSFLSCEINCLKAELCDHKKLVEELKGTSSVQSRALNEQEGCLQGLREKLNSTVTLLRHVENTSSSRFESVFGALEKFRVLTDKVSLEHHRRSQKESSLVNLIQETRNKQEALSVELRDVTDRRHRDVEKDVCCLNKRLSELECANDELVRKINQTIKCDERSPMAGEYRRRLDFLNSFSMDGDIKVDLEAFIRKAIRSEQVMHERNYKEILNFISQQRSAVQAEIDSVLEEVKSVGRRVSRLMDSVGHSEKVGEDLKSVTVKIVGLEDSINSLHGEMRSLIKSVSPDKAAPSTSCPGNSPELSHKSDAEQRNGVLQVRDIVRFVTEDQFSELMLLAAQNKARLSTQESEIKDILGTLSGYGKALGDHTQSHKCYAESLNGKLSDIVTEFNFLRDKLMALEVRTTSALSHSEQLGSLPKCRGNGNEPDTSGIVAHLTGALLQVQAVSVDYESVHCALSRLEGKVEAVTSKLAAVSEGISAKEQRRERDITSLCDSCKGFRTHILSLEDQMNSLERDVVANKRSTSALAVDLHNLEEAFQFLRGNVKKLKDTLVNCVTNASDEWNEVCTQISMFSSFASMYRADKAVNTEGFVRVEHRLDACEQALSQVLGDGCNHKCMGITHKPVRSETVSDMELEAETIMKHHLQPSSERNVNVKGGEGLGAGQSASAANDKHALNPPEDRSGLWADGAPKNLIPTPLPSALDVVMSLLTTFDHRLQQVRDDVTEIRVSEKILTAQSAYMRVPDLVSSLEDCLTACSQAFVESKESISLCHEHIKCLEQHLSSKGAYQTLDEHRVSPNEGVANENSGGASMKEILERLKHNEHILSEVQLSLPAQKSDMNITYTKSEIDDRFANQWVSFVALLARKEDQDALEGKLANLSWTLLDNVTMRIDALSRELNRAINERARLTEVQEMLSNRVG